MKAWIDWIGSTCGVGEISGYHNPSDHYSPDNLTPENIKDSGGGIGYNIAGFLNSNNCKAVYEEIKRDYDIVFQSPVKRNKNSGNDFFFIVFKLKD